MNVLLASAALLAEIHPRGWFPTWLALVLWVAAVAAVAVLYALEAGRLGPVRRIALAAVRMGILAVVAFLLLRPVWVEKFEGERQRPVAVLLDVSQSMAQKDPRPDARDQWRAALALDLIEPGKGFPTESVASVTAGKLPDRPSRWDVARAALTNPRLDLVNRFKKVGPVEVSTFGTARSGGKDANDLGWLADQPADAPRTALTAAALDLLNRDDNDLPAAVVLVTDGRENAGPKTLAAVAERYRERKIPLHIYGVGSSSFGQLKVAKPAVPGAAFQDDTVTFPVEYSIKGVPNPRVEVIVRVGGRVVPIERERLSAAGDEVTDLVSFTPTKEDAEATKKELTVTVKVTPGGDGGGDPLEETVAKPFEVTDRRLRVLVVDGLPRKDFQFLKWVLERESKRIDTRFFLTSGDPEAMGRGTPRPPWLPELARVSRDGRLQLTEKEFSDLINGPDGKGRFELLVLGDVPGQFFAPEHHKVIKRFVREGGGLLHIAGRAHAPREWLGGDAKGDSIADMLPVDVAPVRFEIQPQTGRYGEPFVPALAPGAAGNPIVRFERELLDNADLWGRLGSKDAGDARAGRRKQLPPIEWYYPATRLKPGARAFLIHPTDRTPQPDDKPVPLLAGHYYGAGYVMFCAFDDTWRWRFNEGDRYFGQFWRQTVYQAGMPRLSGNRLTQVSIDPEEPVRGKSGQAYARVLDPSGKASVARTVSGTIERVGAKPTEPDARVEVELQRLDGDGGEYAAPLSFNQAGRFRLTVTPNNKSPASVEYTVGLPPDDEMAPGVLAETDMAALAAGTGSAEHPGKFYREEDLHTLADDLKAQYAKFTRRDETVLWNRWAMFLLIGLLTVEWFLRKFSGLS